MISNFSVKKPKQNKSGKQPSQNNGGDKNKFSASLVVMIAMGLLFIVSLIPVASKFLIGSFGFLIYPAIVFTFIVALAKYKQVKYKFTAKFIILQALTVFIIFELIQLMITGKYINLEFTEHMKTVYNSVTAGGVVFALFAWAISSAITLTGSYILFLISLVVVAAFIIEYFYGRKQGEKLIKKKLSNVSTLAGQQDVKLNEDNKVIQTEAQKAGVIGWDAEEIDTAKLKEYGLNKEELQKEAEREAFNTKMAEIKYNEKLRAEREKENLKSVLGLNKQPAEAPKKPSGMEAFKQLLHDAPSQAMARPNINLYNSGYAFEESNSNGLINADRYKENLKPIENNFNQPLNNPSDIRPSRPEKVVFDINPRPNIAGRNQTYQYNQSNDEPTGNDLSSFTNFKNYGEDGIISHSRQIPSAYGRLNNDNQFNQNADSNNNQPNQNQPTNNNVNQNQTPAPKKPIPVYNSNAPTTRKPRTENLDNNAINAINNITIPSNPVPDQALVDVIIGEKLNGSKAGQNNPTSNTTNKVEANSQLPKEPAFVKGNLNDLNKFENKIDNTTETNNVETIEIPKLPEISELNDSPIINATPSENLDLNNIEPIANNGGIINAADFNNDGAEVAASNSKRADEIAATDKEIEDVINALKQDDNGLIVKSNNEPKIETVKPNEDVNNGEILNINSVNDGIISAHTQHAPSASLSIPDLNNITPATLSEGARALQNESSDYAVEEPSERVRAFQARFKQTTPKAEQETFIAEEPKTNAVPKFYQSEQPYNKPPIELLNIIEVKVDEEEDNAWFAAQAEKLEDTLGSFNVPVSVTNIVKGPAVTRYELSIQAGVPVKRIMQYESDIAMSLEANGGIRIEAPIPGKNAIGIEIPNKTISPVAIREVIESYEFDNSKPLEFALGKDITGQKMLCNIQDMPHLLIAGSTGAGKSVALNTLLISLLYKLSPRDLKIILIDPKRVEFSSFNGLPHMIMPNAIVEPKDAINALGWATVEMDRRYQLFHDKGVKNIIGYNAREAVLNGEDDHLPTILIVIDELADLMQTGKREVEDRIKRLTALARAAGIHLVVATQRPSVDVLTGTIKVNLPSRIAFAVTSGPDSKTILDQTGAENLLGKGDMLYSPQSFPDPRRVQGAFISNEEVVTVVDYIKANNESYFDSELMNKVIGKEEPKPQTQSSGDMDDEAKSKFDPLLPKALLLAIETGQASITMIQRRYGVGYAKAARIIDQMEQAAFISPAEGAKPRKVYATQDDFNMLFPDFTDK